MKKFVLIFLLCDLAVIALAGGPGEIDWRHAAIVGISAVIIGIAGGIASRRAIGPERRKQLFERLRGGKAEDSSSRESQPIDRPRDQI